MKRQQGFTLIELMIVVAIIGILAAIALPAYQDYTARAQAAEALTITAGLRTDIVERLALGQDVPALTTTEVDLQGKYVASVSRAEGGDLTVTFESDSAVGATTMLLEIVDDRRWTCAVGGTTPMSENHLPGGCKP